LLNVAIRYFRQPTKQSRGAHGVTRSRRTFAFSNLDPRCRQQDQALEEHAQRALSMGNLPSQVECARKMIRTSLRCAVIPLTNCLALPESVRNAPLLVRRYGTLDGILDAGRFQTG
jgi:hypothetical protein